jgi:hypothetical protein
MEVVWDNALVRVVGPLSKALVLDAAILVGLPDPLLPNSIS